MFSLCRQILSQASGCTIKLERPVYPQERAIWSLNKSRAVDTKENSWIYQIPAKLNNNGLTEETWPLQRDLSDLWFPLWTGSSDCVYFLSMLTADVGKVLLLLKMCSERVVIARSLTNLNRKRLSVWEEQTKGNCGFQLSSAHLSILLFIAVEMGWGRWGRWGGSLNMQSQATCLWRQGMAGTLKHFREPDVGFVGVCVSSLLCNRSDG